MKPQGARTPNWPAQHAAKPRAPRARPPTGTRHKKNMYMNSPQSVVL